MVNKVFVVMEMWDNDEMYEDYRSTTKILYVTKSIKNAKEAINNRRNSIRELVNKFSSKGEAVTTIEETNNYLFTKRHNAPNFSKRIDTDSDHMDVFQWRIVECPIDKALLSFEEDVKFSDWYGKGNA